MNAQRIRAIVSKEWMDMGKNKMVLIMMALLPVLLVGMILGTVYFMERAPETDFEPGTGQQRVDPARGDGASGPQDRDARADERPVYVLPADDSDGAAGLHRCLQHHRREGDPES
jgi:hypothetical protein